MRVPALKGKAQLHEHELKLKLHYLSDQDRERIAFAVGEELQSKQVQEVRKCRESLAEAIIILDAIEGMIPAGLPLD